VSLDGFAAGPEQGLEHPLGRGGEGLHVELHLVPVVLGAGRRRLDDLGDVAVAQEGAVAGEDVVHLALRVAG
jgi:hypothetical protein